MSKTPLLLLTHSEDIKKYLDNPHSYQWHYADSISGPFKKCSFVEAIEKYENGGRVELFEADNTSSLYPEGWEISPTGQPTHPFEVKRPSDAIGFRVAATSPLGELLIHLSKKEEE